METGNEASAARFSLGRGSWRGRRAGKEAGNGAVPAVGALHGAAPQTLLFATLFLSSAKRRELRTVGGQTICDLRVMGFELTQPNLRSYPGYFLS